jgi:hypothetical protein
MEDQFDLKKFLIENKLTNLSLREEDNDWDIEVGEEWNVQELGVGDYITPEMFQDNKYGNEFKALNQSFKIKRFKVNNTTLKSVKYQSGDRSGDYAYPRNIDLFTGDEASC